MWAWLRGLGRADYQIPPQEAAVISRAAALAGVDIRLSELAGIPRHLRTVAHAEEIERLLDRRSLLTRRPLVPVVPGRSS
jgi:hypothetical protein